MPTYGALVDIPRRTEFSRPPALITRRSLLRDWDDQVIPVDLIKRHVDDFDNLVESFTVPEASAQRREFAYGRLLGVRGALCRLCPSGATELLPGVILGRWFRAESTLRDFLEHSVDDPALLDVITRVEVAWIASAECYMDALMCRMRDAEVECQLGLLKSIDAVAMHLAQRQVFHQTKTLSVPLTVQHEVKLRMRLISLYIMLHSSHFDPSLSVIQSYRDTFRISDPSAYPWWFMDRRLTERQLAWNYRRMDIRELIWRF